MALAKLKTFNYLSHLTSKGAEYSYDIGISKPPKVKFLFKEKPYCEKTQGASY